MGLVVVALLALGYSASDANATFRLLSPAAGAVVSKPPLLQWSPASGARNYNVQLWRANRKILSRWPSVTQLQLHSRWRFRGRWYRLIAARYRWYVWPAYGWGYGDFRSRAFIVGRVPTNISPPLVSGTAREGESLSATAGRWTGTAPLRFSYQWQRCAADGSACIAIAGATSNVVDLVADDIDHAVRVVVTATNLAGARRAASASTAVVLAARPLNLSAPKLKGGFQEGRVVAATTGTWQSSRPVTFSFGWKRCDRAGFACRSISGATIAGYLLRPADFKRRVKVIVRAVNSGGARLASALSPVIGRVFVGTSGPDFLAGSIGADLFRAGAGDDRIAAGRGDDRVYGGRGNDRVSAWRGNDRVIGGSGKDVLYAGYGNDVVLARDGEVDFVGCGSGRDVAIVDRIDHVRRSCETIERG